ncbi:MAG TPA: hypothetical protein VGV06_01880 [Methylomirabilota bacterium]|nr:hypothetical protein [Methylomirabilota bacterium]
MISGARTLAVWLTPAAWLALPALVLEGGPDGVWAGLLLLVAPLLALAVAGGDARAAQPARDALFPVVVFLLVAGLLLWASLVLAGDVAAWLGAPRWRGIGIAAGGAWLLVIWRKAGRLVPWLLLAGILGLAVPLLVVARGAAVGPLGAWERVASQPAFRFPASSPWVSAGRELRAGRGHGVLVFEEEHRITATGPAQIHVRARDGARVSESDWELQPGQSVTLRPGDELTCPPGARLRFEAGKAVPGAPTSGIAWADGRRGDSSRRWGLLLTLTGGALALIGYGATARVTRRQMAAVGAGLLAVFVWGIGWAVYCALGAPDIFLGGIALERLVRPPSLSWAAGVGAAGAGRFVLALVPVAGLASFFASSVALRERIGGLDVTGGGEIGHDLGLWSAIIGAAAVASFWPTEPWVLVLTALGLAASTLAPAVLLPPPAARARWGTWAGFVGLAVFAALALLGQWTVGGSSGWVGLPLAYPAVVAAPAAALVLRLARRAGKG